MYKNMEMTSSNSGWILQKIWLSNGMPKNFFKVEAHFCTLVNWNNNFWNGQVFFYFKLNLIYMILEDIKLPSQMGEIEWIMFAIRWLFGKL